MRIPCPYCGERSSSEFIFRGAAVPVRPESEAGFVDYVYLRDNIAGLVAEHWYHVQGCRQWLRVTRNTVTHAIEEVGFANGAVL